MTYQETLSYLSEARRFGMKPGLEPMHEVALLLGEPQQGLRFIHIAGTNGKGSTAAFCESVLRAAGHRVGLYTSPHLVSIRERIQINREPISEEAFAEGLTAVREAVEKMEGAQVTFFELITALALWHFAREKVDWVVWETGLGGRLDATNIVTPAVCIITSIGLEHQQYLGESLREIAGEKAGIIKPGVPVVSGVEQIEAAQVIRQRAEEMGSPLVLLSRDMEVRNLGMEEGRQAAEINGRRYVLGLIGAHQVANSACAVVALQKLKVPGEAIARGLENTVWPARFEILRDDPLMVLDGAHNPAGMAALTETWRAFLASRLGCRVSETEGRAHLIFSSVSEKNIAEMARLLRPLAKRVSVVRLGHDRGAEPSQLAEAFSDIPCASYDSVSALWREIAATSDSDPILICGSLFLAGEMLAQRHGHAEEYRLNERLEASLATR